MQVRTEVDLHIVLETYQNRIDNKILSPALLNTNKTGILNLTLT